MTESSIISVDGDFPTDTPCAFHCSPTCHPAQTGPEWVYGCTCPVWPQNRDGDFVPIVGCQGKPEKCEIPRRLLRRAISGRRLRVRNALRKARTARQEMRNMQHLLVESREENKDETGTD